MNWKQYKTLPPKQKRDESYYIIGLDIGNDSSAIAFYNMAEDEPEIIDLSGGYGRPTIPTIMQYIVDTKEWVFGEYAILNRGIGREVTLKDLVERLGHSEYVDIDSRPMSIVSLLSMYIKALLANVKNINPKAEIAGIVASVPSYFSKQTKEELIRAFKIAGYEKELISLIADRECAFAYHYKKGLPQSTVQRTVAASKAAEERKYVGNEKILLIDYGAREIRSGVYVISDTDTKDCITLRSISSLFDDSMGTQKVEKAVKNLFADYYKANDPLKAWGLDHALEDQLMAFTYQHKDILFQKAIRSKPVKLYFNFAYPPFQQTVGLDEVKKLIAPFQKSFNQFIRQVLEKNQAKKVTPADVDVVICVGGGFEMLWAREAVASLFPKSKLEIYKNAKTVTAMGAAVAAAQRLEVIEGLPIIVEDKHQLTVDIGLKAGDECSGFIPLAECSSFWWQQHPTRLFVVNAPVEREMPLTIMSRSPEGVMKTLSTTKLTGLLERPKGATRLSINLKFLSDSEALAIVEDYGFGEMFPKTGYVQEIAIKL
ncbi:MAG: DUF5716 family protein [Defluviitaleaceae bacterium]|nr:DUF5716 family protein [Defluviitaleaceae bacterium]